MLEIIITPANDDQHKFVAHVGNRSIPFGDANYQDYTTHKDPKRKKLYIDRHRGNEIWTKKGLKTAGFYSRFLLWGEPTLEASIDKMNQKYKDVNFILKTYLFIFSIQEFDKQLCFSSLDLY